MRFGLSLVQPEISRLLFIILAQLCDMPMSLLKFVVQFLRFASTLGIASLRLGNEQFSDIPLVWERLPAVLTTRTQDIDLAIVILLRRQGYRCSPSS